MKGRKKSTARGASWMIEIEGFTFHVYGKSGAWTASEEMTGAAATKPARTIELAVMAAKVLAEADAVLIPTMGELSIKVNGTRTQRTAKAVKRIGNAAACHCLALVALACEGVAIALKPLAYIAGAFENACAA